MTVSFDSLRYPTSFMNDSHREWQQQLRKFVDTEIMPHVEQWEDDCDVPQELFKKAAEVGILGICYPEELGGMSEGIDTFHRTIAVEELSRAAAGVAMALLVQNIALPLVVGFGPDEMKQEVVPQVLAGDKFISLAITEPSGGSDVANLKTSAKDGGDHFVVNGSKTFITGGLRANWYVTAVRTGDAGMGGISLLLIPADAEGVSATSLGKKQGWHSSQTATIYFDNVKVPKANIIGQLNRGFLAIVNNFNHERLALAAVALSTSRACIEEAADWALNRETFGKPLAQHQVIRHKFAEMIRQLNASYAYLDTCITQVDNGTARTSDIALLKVQATLTAESVCRECLQILGGAGYIKGSVTERNYREVRVLAIGGGSEEIMRDLAGRELGF
ncbi:acyl-CoA dehydrogenase family protein [Bacterioplanoides sp.]|uniref:acyl-CoA dehydrogenase family protein n=1 Tax=Bacterioplanoides sp. TaxID=2066072 RepID=UPI003B592547